MKLARFRVSGRVHRGIVEGETVKLVRRIPFRGQLQSTGSTYSL